MVGKVLCEHAITYCNPIFVPYMMQS